MAPVDRRGPALAALMFFVVATVVALVLDGRLPASEDSVAGWVLQVLGYLAALAAGVLLIAAPAEAGTQRTGFVVVGAVLLLVLMDAVGLTSDEGGANIGAGFVRLVCLVVLAVVTVRLALSVAAARQSRP